MAILHLMVGLPCSGKTALAKQLEREYSALRMTPDEWHIRVFGQDAEEKDHDERHDFVEALLWNVAARALTLGIDVILDYSFWIKSQREEFRERARRLGADCKIHFAYAPEETLLTRLAERNVALPEGAFRIREEKLREWISIFEPPTDEAQTREIGHMCEIHYATPADAAVLGEIHAASWKAAYRGIVPDEVLENMTAAGREKYFREALSSRNEENALLLVNGMPAGFLCLGKCRDADAAPDQGEIWGLYLHPTYWRQGWGGRLLRWGLRELRTRGYTTASLWVLKENGAARGFYERMGFALDGTEKEIILKQVLMECRYKMALGENLKKEEEGH